MTRQMDAPAEVESSRDTLSAEGIGGTSPLGTPSRIECLWGHGAPYVLIAAVQCGECGRSSEDGFNTYGYTGHPRLVLPAEVCRECVKANAECGACPSKTIYFTQAAPQ